MGTEEQAIKTRIRELETWRNQIDTQLPQEKRIEIRDAVNKWKTWIKAVGIVLAVVGLGTPGGILVILTHISTRISQSQSDIDRKISKAETDFNNRIFQSQSDIDRLISKAETDVDESLKNLERKTQSNLEELVSEKTLNDLALKTTETGFQQRFAQDLNQSFFTHISGIASGVKTFLEMQENHPPDFTLPIDPRQIKELLYQIDGMLEQYKGQIASGAMDPNRREAFLFVINGIVDRARGRNDSAMSWFNLAIKKDDQFPEAKIFKAKINLEDTRYLGKGKWSNENKRSEALQLLKGAAESLEASSNLEMQRSLCIIPELEATVGTNGENSEAMFNKAVKLADSAIEQEERERGKENVDPRLYFHKGTALLYCYNEQHNESARFEAFTAYRDGIRIDPEYIKAVNNYLWIGTHNFSDNIMSISNLPEDDIWEMGKRLDRFEKHPLTQYNSELLNTIAEAHLFLARDRDDFAKAASYADRSVELARLYDRKILHLLLERREVITSEIASTFSADDIVNLTSIATKLKHPSESDELSRFLKSRFCAMTQDMLSNYTDGRNPALQVALVQDLNRIILREPIYDSQRSAGLKLSEATSKMLAKNPQGPDLVRLNQALLLDSYPQEISISRKSQIGGL